MTSTFVEKALKLAQPDIDLLVVEQQLRDFEDTQMLAQLFADMLQTDDEGEHKVGFLWTKKPAVKFMDFYVQLFLLAIFGKNTLPVSIKEHVRLTCC